MKSIAGTLLCSIALLCSCGDNSDQLAVSDVKMTENPSAEPNTVEEEGLTDSSTQFFQNSPPPPDPVRQKQPEPLVRKEWDKKIVKSATLNMEVKDFKSFSQNLTDRVRLYGGYISSDVQNSSDYKIESNVVLRVPVDQFDKAMSDLVKDASKLDEKRISAEDQTREFFDSRSRLEAKKQVRLRYLDLLKQAKNMSEILEVQQEINDIQEEIEVVSGRINEINQTAAMSTINLTFYQVLDSSASSDNSDGFFTRLLNAFVKGWKWIGELVIGLSTIWPLLLIMAVAGYFLRKKLVVNKQS